MKRKTTGFIKEKTKSSVLPVQVGGSKIIIKDNSYNITQEDLQSFIQIECIDVIESGTPAYIKPEKQENHSNKIEITENLGMLMKYPSFQTLKMC